MAEGKPSYCAFDVLLDIVLVRSLVKITCLSTCWENFGQAGHGPQLTEHNNQRLEWNLFYDYYL